MIAGPRSAPSSPPETPVPTKWRPFSRRAASRRRVFSKWALPPSMIMSPGSMSSARASMTASVALPACTMIMALRGRFSEATKSASASEGTKAPSPPCSSMSSVVLA